jgi:hypothetical protein
MKKTLLILALAAAASASVQAQSTPAKKELVARILKIQQPAIDNMARGLVTEPLGPLMESAEFALQQRVAADKREAVAKQIQADAKKYADDTTAIVRARATSLAPTTIGPMLEEKFTEDELKQVVAMLESPVLAKFQALGADIQRALIEKVVADTRGQVEPRLKALEASMAKSLGVPAPGSNGAAAGAKPAAPAKK